MNTMPQHRDSCIWSQGDPKCSSTQKRKKKEKKRGLPRAAMVRDPPPRRPVSLVPLMAGAEVSQPTERWHRVGDKQFQKHDDGEQHTCLLRVWRAIVFKDTLTSAALYFVPLPYHHPTRHPQDAGEWFARVGRRNTGGVCWWRTQSASVGFFFLLFIYILLCVHRCRCRVDNFILINCHVEKYARKQTEKNRRSYCCLFLFVFI